MCLGNPFGNRQPQTSTVASVSAGSGGVGLVEAVKDAFQVLGGDTNTCVVNGQMRHISFLMETQGDFATVGGELDGITHQIEQQLLEAIRIAHHADWLDMYQLNGEITVFRQNFRLFKDLSHNGVEVDLREVDLHTAVVGACQQEQVVDHAGHALGLALDGFEGG